MRTYLWHPDNAIEILDRIYGIHFRRETFQAFNLFVVSNYHEATVVIRYRFQTFNHILFRLHTALIDERCAIFIILNSTYSTWYRHYIFPFIIPLRDMPKISPYSSIKYSLMDWKFRITHVPCVTENVSTLCKRAVYNVLSIETRLVTSSLRCPRFETMFLTSFARRCQRNVVFCVNYSSHA